jgi:hypothetical protein
MNQEPPDYSEQSHESLWRLLVSKWNDLRLSLRVIIGAAILGYVPIFGAELLRRPFGINGDELAGFGLGWGFWITIPCTLVGILFLLYEVVHLITGWGE